MLDTVEQSPGLCRPLERWFRSVAVERGGGPSQHAKSFTACSVYRPITFHPPKRYYLLMDDALQLPEVKQWYRNREMKYSSRLCSLDLLIFWPQPRFNRTTARISYFVCSISSTWISARLDSFSPITRSVASAWAIFLKCLGDTPASYNSSSLSNRTPFVSG